MSFAHLTFDILFFFGAGHVFGHLTKNLNTFKVIILLIIGGVAYILFLDMNPVQQISFLGGMLSHHTPRILRAIAWARSLGDMAFALRYRSAYEDIQRREREIYERERQFEEEKRKWAYGQQQQRQSQWQNDARNFRQQDEGANKQSGGKSQSSQGQQKSKQCSSGGQQKQQQSRGQQRQQQGSQQQRQKSSNSQGSGGFKYSFKYAYLETLGLEPGKEYTPTELKKAYRKMAMKYHPDRHKEEDKKEAEEMMKKINAAYSELTRVKE